MSVLVTFETPNGGGGLFVSTPEGAPFSEVLEAIEETTSGLRRMFRRAKVEPTWSFQGVPQGSTWSSLHDALDRQDGQE